MTNSLLASPGQAESVTLSVVAAVFSLVEFHDFHQGVELVPLTKDSAVGHYLFRDSINLKSYPNY